MRTDPLRALLFLEFTVLRIRLRVALRRPLHAAVTILIILVAIITLLPLLGNGEGVPAQAAVEPEAVEAAGLLLSVYSGCSRFPLNVEPGTVSIIISSPIGMQNATGWLLWRRSVYGLVSALFLTYTTGAFLSRSFLPNEGLLVLLAAAIALYGATLGALQVIAFCVTRRFSRAGTVQSVILFTSAVMLGLLVSSGIRYEGAFFEGILQILDPIPGEAIPVFSWHRSLALAALCGPEFIPTFAVATGLSASTLVAIAATCLAARLNDDLAEEAVSIGDVRRSVETTDVTSAGMEQLLMETFGFRRESFFSRWRPPPGSGWALLWRSLIQMERVRLASYRSAFTIFLVLGAIFSPLLHYFDLEPRLLLLFSLLPAFGSGNFSFSCKSRFTFQIPGPSLPRFLGTASLDFVESMVTCLPFSAGFSISGLLTGYVAAQEALILLPLLFAVGTLGTAWGIVGLVAVSVRVPSGTPATVARFALAALYLICILQVVAAAGEVGTGSLCLAVLIVSALLLWVGGIIFDRMVLSD